MKTQKQIIEKIREIESILEDAESKGTSRHIQTFSDLRKFKTRLLTLAWVIDETKKDLGGRERMNAQTLIDLTPTTNFNFGVFWGRTRESSQSQIKRGDKFVARCGNNQYHQVNSEGSYTFYPSESISHSLMPRTSDLLQQININNCKNTATFKGDVIRSMGLGLI